MSAKSRKTEPINIARVKEDLRTEVLGHPLLYFRELPSTNDMAKALAEKGIREGSVIVAETQSNGRGRLKRKWVSPPGGLWFSIVLRSRIRPKHAPKLTLMTSVAVAKTIRKMFGLKAEIKWPNDVMVSNRKICGILTSAQTRGRTLGFVVVGIGLNVNFDVDALPSYLRKSATTLMHELKREVDRQTLLRSLLEEVETTYGAFKRGRFNVILRQWRSLAAFLGSEVEIENGKEGINGLAVDIDEDGALIVKLKDQTLTKVTTGDLRVRQRQAL